MSPDISKPLDIYVRVSDVRGRSGESFISPKDQEARCRALALARGYSVGQVFEELNVSGGSMNRPMLAEALQRIRDGLSGGILVARMDRFARTLKGAIETLEEIEEAGGYLIEVDGDWDTSTPMGRFGRDLVIRLAQLYREQIADQWQTAKAHAVERGIHIAPRVAAGYKRNGSKRLEPDGANAETISEAYRMAAAGDSYRRIADYLNERKLPLWSGEGLWQPNRIRRLLSNRVYLGEARSGNGHVNEGAHEALVDEATFLLAQRHSSAPALTTRARTMLAGLGRCASCSFSLKAKGHRGDPHGLYRCERHASIHGRCEDPVSITRRHLDAYVLEQFLGRASVTLEQSQDDAGRDEAVDAALRAEQSYRAALTNTELRGRIGNADHDAMVASLHDAWQDALRVIPARSSHDLRSVDLARLVSDLQEAGDVDGLRELLSTQIQAVFVKRAASRARGLPIGDRVHIVWTDEPELELPKRGTRFEPRAFQW